MSGSLYIFWRHNLKSNLRVTNQKKILRQIHFWKIHGFLWAQSCPIDAEKEMANATTREKSKKQKKNPEQQAPCDECHARLQQPLLQLQLLGVLEEVPVVGHQAEEATGDEVLGVGARGRVQDDAQLPQGLHPAQWAELAVHRDGRGGKPRGT